MKKLLIAFIATAGMISVTAPAYAHHAFAAEYDALKPVTLKGSLTKLEWVNPHAWLHVDVKGDDGKVTNWAIEFGSPNALLRRGLREHQGGRIEGGLQGRASRADARVIDRHPDGPDEGERQQRRQRGDTAPAVLHEMRQHGHAQLCGICLTLEFRNIRALT